MHVIDSLRLCFDEEAGASGWTERFGMATWLRTQSFTYSVQND